MEKTPKRTLKDEKKFREENGFVKPKKLVVGKKYRMVGLNKNCYCVVAKTTLVKAGKNECVVSNGRNEMVIPTNDLFE